jgi:ethanolamine ammonia-lyase small subunit
VKDASPLVPDPWTALRRFTSARIAAGRAGASLPTRELLRFNLDHAVARDAVHSELDFNALASALSPLGLQIVQVQTQVCDRLTYLQRPDFGRKLDDGSRTALTQLASAIASAPHVCIIIADGLSGTAVQLHAAPLLEQLVPKLRASNLQLAPLILAKFGRVALQDDIGSVLRAQSALILIGERPGLGAADSLSAYFVYHPRIGNTDANRNCVSNIRPTGLPLNAAAETIEYLITRSLERGISGTALKDERLGSARGKLPAV